MQPSRKVKLQQDNKHLAGLKPGRPDQFVDIDRARSERADDPLALARADVGEGPRCAMLGAAEASSVFGAGDGRRSVKAPRRCRSQTAAPAFCSGGC